MPVTRSSNSRSLSRHSIITPSPRRAASNSATHQVSDDVIFLSDLEDRPAQKSKKTSASKAKPKSDKQRGKARAKPLAPIGEVFEISSEDEQPGPSFGLIAELQSKVQKLQKENASLKAARKPEVDKKQVVLDVSKVEDFISCAICAHKMWRPFILPECGHTFCQGCLEDWFNTILAQHMTTHPQYNHNSSGLPGQIRDLLASNTLNAQAQAYIQAMYPHCQPLVPSPQYTCPTCRDQVKNKPVEDFALKSLVKMIAGAAGESSPAKSAGRSKSRVVKKRGGTWDAFFRTAV